MLEISNYHRKVTIEALTKVNLELTGAKDAYNFLEGQIKWYVDELKKAREEAQVAMEKAVKKYVANIHLTEEYKSFNIYWRNYVYA